MRMSRKLLTCALAAFGLLCAVIVSTIPYDGLIGKGGTVEVSATDLKAQRSLPPMDRVVPVAHETATFGLG